MEGNRKTKAPTEDRTLKKIKELRDSVLEQRRTTEVELIRLRSAVSQRENHSLKLEGALEAIELLLTPDPNSENPLEPEEPEIF